MTNIGKIFEEETDLGTTYKGYIQTLEISHEFILDKIEDHHKAEKGPDFNVKVRTTKGDLVQIGAVWKRVAKKAGMTGQEFLSMSIDDPSFPRPINVNAYKNREGSWNIIWRRRDESSAA